MSDCVSPSQGKDSIAQSSVKKTTAHLTHSSRPTLFSKYHGPLIYNETDEERAKREADEKAKADADKQSNFKKVQEKAEREEEARKAAEEERDQLRKEKEEREKAEREAAEKKLEEDKEFQTLAEQREAEAKLKAEEAEKANARAEAAEAKLKAIDDEKEEELKALLEEIPEEKRPPLDDGDSVSKRLKQVKHVSSLLKVTVKKKVGGAGGGGNGDVPAEDRKKELLEAKLKRPLTEDEKFELMELSDE